MSYINEKRIRISIRMDGYYENYSYIAYCGDIFLAQERTLKDLIDDLDDPGVLAYLFNDEITDEEIDDFLYESRHMCEGKE